MSFSTIIRRSLLYLGTALASLAIFALIFFLTVRSGTSVPFRWVMLTVFSVALLFIILKYYRAFWNRPALWLCCAGVLTVHLAIFIPILRSYPEFRPLWFVPIVVVEAAIAGAICGPLLRNSGATAARRTHPESHK